MTRILLLAHAPLASALKAVATHAFPDCASELVALDVDAQASADDVEQAVRGVVEAGGAVPTLILADVFGATPCNAAQRVADGVHARVVTGVNVPMLWRTLCYQGEALDALLDRAVAGATLGVVRVGEAVVPNQSEPAVSVSHDQVRHRHQQ
jgi:mannose PTS system EIIA component